MLTDLQLKILKYIAKRKTLATAKEIQLQTRMSLATVSRALKTLTNKGYIRSKSTIVGFVKVRQYKLVKMMPDEITSTKKTCIRFARKLLEQGERNETRQDI